MANETVARELPTLYFLGNQLLGEGAVRQTTQIVRSLLYWCPECGEAWGRVMVPGMPWAASARRCPKCGPGFLIPREIEYCLHIPKEVGRRELILISQLQDRAGEYISHLSRLNGI